MRTEVYPFRINRNTKSLTWSISSRVMPSTFSLKSGSVFDGRTLNDQSFAETVRPSNSSKLTGTVFDKK
jgi:hypothetical protein